MRNLPALLALSSLLALPLVACSGDDGATSTTQSTSTSASTSTSSTSSTSSASTSTTSDSGTDSGSASSSGSSSSTSSSTGGSDSSSSTSSSSSTGDSDSSSTSGTTTGGVIETCDDFYPVFQAEVAVIRGCSEDAECGQVLEGTSCGCTRNWVARLDADTTDFLDLVDLGVELECDLPFISTCDCPEADGYACVDGTCTWNYL